MKRKLYCVTCGTERNPKCKPGQCQDCRTKENRIRKREEEILYLESIGYKVIDSKPILNKHLKPVYNLIRIECGHDFSAVFGNIQKQLIEYGMLPCSVCGKEIQKNKTIERNKLGCPEKAKEAFAKYNMLRSAEALERYQSKEYNDFIEYTKYVRFLSDKTFCEHYYEINPQNLKRGKDYHLDHIVPIYYCFHNNISAEKCASAENLQLLSNEENRQKHHKLNDASYILLEKWSNVS